MLDTTLVTLFKLSVVKMVILVGVKSIDYRKNASITVSYTHLTLPTIYSV